MTRIDELPDVLTVRDVQIALRIGRNQAYALIDSGALRGVRVGRSIRVSKRALTDFMDAAHEGAGAVRR
jgi:excisionase family DNA binding protein